MLDLLKPISGTISRPPLKKLLIIQFQASNYFYALPKVPPDFVKILKLKKSILGVFPKEELKVTKMVIFNKTCIEWSFHSMKIPKIRPHNLYKPYQK